MQKFSLALLASLSFSTVIFGQVVRLEQARIDSIKNRNWPLGSELQTIRLYNNAIKLFAYEDTISVFKINDRFEYFYKNTLLKGISFQKSEFLRPIQIDGYQGYKQTFLFTKVQQNPSNSFEILVLNAKFNENELVLSLTNFQDDIKISQYVEKTMSGQVLVKGQYCQVDSNYVETFEYIDPETYETSIKHIKRSKLAIKTGKWNYYLPSGELWKEEDFGPCN